MPVKGAGYPHPFFCREVQALGRGVQDLLQQLLLVGTPELCSSPGGPRADPNRISQGWNKRGNLFCRGLQQSKSYSTETSSHAPRARTLAENEAEAKPWDTATAIHKARRENQEGGGVKG